jgi:hypothetical protein
MEISVKNGVPTRIFFIGNFISNSYFLGIPGEAFIARISTRNLFLWQLIVYLEINVRNRVPTENIHARTLYLEVISRGT